MGKKAVVRRRQRTAGATTGDQKAASDDLQLDPRGDGLYSGTFRWRATKKFPPLPPVDNQRRVDLDHGWQGYLASRSDSAHDLVKEATRDPACLDALSFPVTLLHIVELLGLGRDGDVHVVVIGASSKAEQRVWAITDYWSELALLRDRIKLYFVGPEVDTECQKSESLRAHHVRATFGEFSRSPMFAACLPTNTVIIGYNTGFGNFVDSGDHRLLLSWLPDLYAIADCGIPAIFTCANDYADMNGEFAVQSQIVGAKFLLLPQQNPFSAASHLHEEGKRDTAWSRGNSFLYVVQGADQSRRLQVASETKSIPIIQTRLDADMEDLHLVDALGRHFFRGIVLSKDQAARCKAPNGSTNATTSTTATATTTKTHKAMNTSTSVKGLATPKFDLLPGSRAEEVLIRVHVPDVRSPTEQVAIDFTDSTLSVLVPGKYLLREQLPFQVDRENGCGPRAQLAPPFLVIAVRRK